MSKPNVYALLVGVDRYDNPRQAPHLRGCVADTQAMHNFLTTRLAVPADRILWLTSKMDQSEPPELRATRQNILRGWQQHLAQAGEGDHVFFHYSGHGAQAKTISPETEPDGLDETIVPADSRTPGVYDILDKELAALIAGIEANGAKVTCFMDCCHSGSGTRKTMDAAEDAPRTRLAAGDDRDRPLETVVTAPSGTRSISGPKGPSGILPLSQHILLSGCRDEELSHEYKSPETDQWQGATTYFLMKKLAQYRPGMTWGEIHDYVQGSVNTVYAAQSPQLEGPAEMEAFGGIGTAARPHLTVQAIDAEAPDFVKLNAGIAVGLTESSRVAIFAPGQDMEGQPVVRATVDKVKTDHSWAKLDTSMPIEVGSRATITDFGIKSVAFKVATADAGFPVAVAGKYNGQPSPFFETVASDTADADYRVAIENGRYMIQDGSGTQIAYEMPKIGAEGAAKTLEMVEHLCRYRSTLALRNTTSGALEGLVTITAVEITNPGSRQPKKRSIQNAGNEHVISEGQYVEIRFKNSAPNPIYAAVYMLDETYAVTRIWPGRAANQLINPGVTVVALDSQKAELTDKRLSRAKIVFKVFATAIPTKFDAIVLPALNHPGSITKTRAVGDSALAQLLNASQSDGTRFVIQPKDSTEDEWTTAQVELTVLASDRAVDLPADTEEVDAGTTLDITVKKPKGFFGRLLSSTLGNASRAAGDAGGIPTPPGLYDGEGKYFAPVGMGAGGTRSADASPVVLGFDAEADQLASITPDNPLTLELSVENDPNIAGLMPIAYDGEFFYFAGSPTEATGTRSVSSDKRSMAVTVDFLPVPEAKADDGQVGTRDLKRTVNLFLYKILHNQLPPGLGVRKADLDIAGQPAYAAVNADDIRQSKRVALMVHGFTSDTGWLVYYAWPFAKQHGYDLCLTYDYETFNTRFKENGRLLHEQLVDLGFGPNDGVKLDIFCHSMGTQVSRAMIELWGGEEFVDRVFMGGALNAGSALAKARQLLPWISTVMLNGGASAVPPLMVAAWALKKITDMAVGVQDMDPDSAFYQEINSRTEPVTVPYYVQIGNNSRVTGQSVNWTRLFTKAGMMKAADAGLDVVLGGDNDIAVGVSSAKAVESPKYPNAQVTVTTGNHFHYFTDPESKTILEGLI